MAAPARPMQLASPMPATRGLGYVARQFTAVAFGVVIFVLLVASAMAVGAFLWRDVPRIAGGTLSALSQGSYGPDWFIGAR